MIPGDNILEDALSVISTTTIQYLKYSTRTLNTIGQYVTDYAAPVDIEASVQAVERNTYVELGLDFQKKYVYIYASIDAVDLDRDVTGDRFIVPNGRIYQLESQIDWFSIDGWIGCLCVQVDFP